MITILYYYLLIKQLIYHSYGHSSRSRILLAYSSFRIESYARLTSTNERETWYKNLSQISTFKSLSFYNCYFTNMLQIATEKMPNNARTPPKPIFNNSPFNTPSPKSSNTINPQESKQKSELCRRYMQYGFCPYQKRCKFAHGSHQLLKNHQTNNKYKTKQCQNFKSNNWCMYGNRCNFIHTRNDSFETIRYGKNVQDPLFRVLLKQRQKSSRLMSLLG